MFVFVSRKGVKYFRSGEHYRMIRLAYLTAAETVQVGIMCASPEWEGFQVILENFHIQAL
ncbi:DUF1349 domain-containing protein [Coleofasciculus chthonoplastes]|uniref:DUF1349 domain-containing protein n=1 Tax=Coleofasciculus chthonoplastes TaxID=64178 RepID=UPI0040646CAE